MTTKVKQPHVLVTNDDGIDSAFLHRLVNALTPHFRVSVAAPATEQSWIGRAVSRHRDVTATVDTTTFSESVQAWAIHGTPTDCVNIALGNLLARLPDIVVSGINIGYNTTETLILSSGTIAGAIEGALWDLPAIAFSQYVPGSIFEQIQKNNGHCEGPFEKALLDAAEQAAQITVHTLENPPTKSTLLNINFPAETSRATTIKDTFPAKIQLGSLYEEASPGIYRFRYTEGILLESDPNSDRTALEQGFISRSLLNFSNIGTRNK
ncbi:MAG: 5'/3'-nucleotidase SurE [Lentimonas sp.]